VGFARIPESNLVVGFARIPIVYRVLANSTTQGSWSAHFQPHRSATDDSHDYHGKPRAAPGRGWIVVRSRWLTPESILESMKQADFYASTGIELDRLEFDEATGTLTIQIKPDGDAQFTTQFIGTPVQYDSTTRKRTIPGSDEVLETLDYSADVGKVLATIAGHNATYQLHPMSGSPKSSARMSMILGFDGSAACSTVSGSSKTNTRTMRNSFIGR